jgi:hypothetical protein
MVPPPSELPSSGSLPTEQANISMASLRQSVNSRDLPSINNPNAKNLMETPRTSHQPSSSTALTESSVTPPQESSKLVEVHSPGDIPVQCSVSHPQSELPTVSLESKSEVSKTPDSCHVQAALYQSFVDNMMKQPKAKRKAILQQITTSQDMKKIRGTSVLARDLKIDRRTLTNLRKPSASKKKLYFEEAEKHVLTFLTRPEHSYVMPGKKDTITLKGVKHQRIQLTEFLDILHKQYNAEFPMQKVGLTFFSGVRREHRYISLVKCNNVNVCLCLRHQNFALMMQPLKGMGLPQLPDTFVKECDADVISQKLSELPDVIFFQRWKNVDQKYTTPQGEVKQSKKLRIVEEEKQQPSFTAAFLDELKLMKGHIERVYAQHKACRELREKLGDHECTAQMDFAENWMISYPNEPQSVYYGKEPVTLYPTVIHFSNGNKKSLALVTDDRKHDSGAVYAFLKVIIDIIKSEHPDVSTIHYLTDGPSSQYRNVCCLSLIANHEEIFGIKASWLYFEAGHGKGPCDGIGAVAKRMADYTVKRNIFIHNANDFAAAGNRVPGTIQYINVPVEQIVQARKEIYLLSQKKSIPGTMKAHAAVSPSPGTVALRSTSCYGTCCQSAGQWILGCPGWTLHTMENVKEADSTEQPLSAKATVEEGVVEPFLNSWIGATYDDKWYIGQIINLDEKQEDYRVAFMSPGNGVTCENNFKWPEKPDILDIKSDDILTLISEPKQYGSGRRTHFEINKKDMEDIIDKYIIKTIEQN